MPILTLIDLVHLQKRTVDEQASFHILTAPPPLILPFTCLARLSVVLDCGYLLCYLSCFDMFMVFFDLFTLLPCHTYIRYPMSLPSLTRSLPTSGRVLWFRLYIYISAVATCPSTSPTPTPHPHLFYHHIISYHIVS